MADRILPDDSGAPSPTNHNEQPRAPGSDDFSEGAEIRRGAQAFVQMMYDVKKLPEVLRPGYQRGQDDSVRYNVESAEALILSQLESDAGLQRLDDRALGFVRAMAVLMLTSFDGVEVISGDIDMDVSFVLQEHYSDVPAPGRETPAQRCADERGQLLSGFEACGAQDRHAPATTQGGAA
jgi:hypothetical protein